MSSWFPTHILPVISNCFCKRMYYRYMNTLNKYSVSPTMDCIKRQKLFSLKDKAIVSEIAFYSFLSLFKSSKSLACKRSFNI